MMKDIMDMAMIHQIADRARSTDGIEVLEQPRIGEGAWRNELVFFVKPELLQGGVDQIIKRLQLISNKFLDFGPVVRGIVVVGGAVLGEKQIMDRHYGVINRLSRSASTMLKKDDKTNIAQVLGLHSVEGFEILGGHEYLLQYPAESAADLDRLWFTKKSIKIKSGFYVQAYEKGNKRIILVNGFHPVQLYHFTNPSHRIVLMLLHSDTTWEILRDRMVGVTFPEKAVRESIRGALYAHSQEYGLGSVSIANNGVHLSAGPFEGMFEVSNLFGVLLGINIERTQPLILRQMLKGGIQLDQALRTLENPLLDEANRSIDLFTKTENIDSENAIEIWRQYLSRKLIGK